MSDHTKLEPRGSNKFHGIIVSCSRRRCTVLSRDGQLSEGGLLSKHSSSTVGDDVIFEVQGGQCVVKEILPRRNCLMRSVLERSKTIAANVDLLGVVCSLKPLFNSLFIDRALTAAHAASIQALLIINKCDLDLNQAEALAAPYRQINIPVNIVSAKSGTGIAELAEIIDRPENKIVTFCGISGVGKSSLLNCLVPDALRLTGTVSDKTGQGKQTTSQSYAYSRKSPDGSTTLIVDSPGLQQFGLTHVSIEELIRAFTEVASFGESCKFQNCSHIREQKCSVKDALARGDIAQSRYDSYLTISAELQEKIDNQYR